MKKLLPFVIAALMIPGREHHPEASRPQGGPLTFLGIASSSRGVRCPSAELDASPVVA
jgi:hypothetical protein